MLEHYGVFESRPISECEGVKRLRARWEPQQRGDEIKWRYVAQEFKWMEERDDCFAAASTATTAKIVDFMGLKVDDAVNFVADCVKALPGGPDRGGLRGAAGRVPRLAGRPGGAHGHPLVPAQDAPRTTDRWFGLDCYSSRTH